MQKGLTLLELMLVMSIMGIVFGVGLGAFASLDTPDDSALGLVRSTLRAASNQAQTKDTQTRVLLVHENANGVGELRPSQLFTAGTWHFEDESLKGAFDLNGVGNNLRVADDGFIGRGLSLGQSEAEARFAVRSDPAFDPREGFVIEFALRPDAKAPAEGHVLDLGRSVGLDLMADGSMRGWIAPDFTEGPAREPGSSDGGTFLFVESPAGSIVPGRWSRVRLEYDRHHLGIDVNGRPFERLPASLPLRALAGDLVLSNAERQGYRGDVDKLVIGLVQLAEPITLPAGVSFTASTPKEINFSGGGLDPRQHTRPVEIGLLFQDLDGSHEGQVRVNLHGTVE